MEGKEIPVEADEEDEDIAEEKTQPVQLEKTDAPSDNDDNSEE